jgi:hypothetical protein
MKKTVVGAVLESGVDERWRRDGRRAALEGGRWLRRASLVASRLNHSRASPRCGRGYRLALFGLSTQACLSASR